MILLLFPLVVLTTSRLKTREKSVNYITEFKVIAKVEKASRLFNIDKSNIKMRQEKKEIEKF